MRSSPLRARSAAEAHLYMDLHPCACGEHRFPRTCTLVERGDDLASCYQGPCQGCGAARGFEFLLPDLPEPATASLSYGGAQPSELLDPGEFMAASEQAARAVPASAAGASAEERRARRVRTEEAIAALAEVLKFIPPGGDRVPAAAFRTGRGKESYLAEPGRFRRPRLEAVLETYRQLLREHADA